MEARRLSSLNNSPVVKLRRLKRVANDSDTSPVERCAVSTGPQTPSSPQESVECSESGSDDQESQGAAAISSAWAFSEHLSDCIVNNLGGQEECNRRTIRDHIAGGRCSLNTSFALPPELFDFNESFTRLKTYQQAGVQWLLTLHEADRNGILADEMGLGKTAQACVFLNHLYKSGRISGKTVVACPATLVDNWCNEVGMWTSCNFVKYHGSQKERKEKILEIESNKSETHIIITSLQTLTAQWDRAVFFKHLEFEYLVVDEAHNLKNASSQLHTKMKKKIRAKRRLLMTGSPVQNEITELRNLLLFVAPPSFTSETLDIALTAFAEQLESAKKREDKGDLNKNSLDNQENGSTEFKENGSTEYKENGSTEFMENGLNEFKMLNLKKKGKALHPDVIFLSRLLAPLILRRSKAQVMGDLPQKHTVIDRCDMTGWQLDLYVSELKDGETTLGDALRGLKSTLADLEGQAGADASPASSAASPGACRLKRADSNFVRNLAFRLRRICNHPALFQGYFSPRTIEQMIDYYHKRVHGYVGQPRSKVEEHIRQWSDFEIHQNAGDHLPDLDYVRLPRETFLESCKLRRMIELVQSFVGQGEKALVFSQFTTYLDFVEETLILHLPNIHFVRLDGKTSVAERQTLVDEFQSNAGIHLFLLSTKAGGVGLNLTAATRVILLDQDWNPHNDRQAEDRVHRLGQTKDVTIHRICCRGSVEEVILKCCQKKLDLDEAFGGNTERLSAAIMKDSFTTARELIERHRMTKKREARVDTPSGDENRIPRKKKKNGTKQATSISAEPEEAPLSSKASYSSQSTSSKSSPKSRKSAASPKSRKSAASPKSRISDASPKSQKSDAAKRLVTPNGKRVARRIKRNNPDQSHEKSSKQDPATRVGDAPSATKRTSRKS